MLLLFMSYGIGSLLNNYDSWPNIYENSQLQAACESTGTHQTDVLRGGSAGVDELARARVNAIAADQERAFGGGAVGEGSDHSLFACHLKAVKLLAKGNLEALAHGFLTHNPVQGASLDDHAWCSHPGPGAIGHLSKTFAFPARQDHEGDR
jgi:hypothetical protein